MQKNKCILVTGSCGFIGYHLSFCLLSQGYRVIGFDNMNDYYEVQLKEDRLQLLKKFQNFTYIRGDISDKEEIEKCFKDNRPDIVINLAAQAGVRHSIENPYGYLQSNIVGFLNILECCRHYPVNHLLFASSSSVYGANMEVPYSVDAKTDCPVSFYAATKKSNELMAYSYSKLYKIPATGLRFFTVYGPLGRPDMAYFKFTKQILSGDKIQLYNNGIMYRDFTYIDDIVKGIAAMLDSPPVADENQALYKLYNIGNHNPVKLSEFVQILEECWGIEAEKEYLPMQPGDVYQTCADITELKNNFGFTPTVALEDGLRSFVEWYKGYYKI